VTPAPGSPEGLRDVRRSCPACQDLRRRSAFNVAQAFSDREEMQRLTAEHAWFDKLTMSAHPEPVEGCVLGGRGG